MVENLEKKYFSQNEALNKIEEGFLKIKEEIKKKDLVWQSLNEITKEISKKEKAENPDLLINPETGRIDMDEYHKVYKNEPPYKKEVQEGIEETLKEYKEKWLEDIINKKIDLQNYAENTLKGEKAELFILTNLYKFLKEEFIIVRSSYYDDVDNGIDTIIVDKNNGDIICAFDEAASFSIHFEEKKNKILEKNLKGGGRLKYGIKLEKQNNKINIKGTPIKNIPVFYLPINLHDVEENILKQQTKISLDDINEIDRLTFYFLMINIYKQAKDFIILSQNQEINFPMEIAQKAKNFIEKINKIYPNIFFEDKKEDILKKGSLSSEFYTNKTKISKNEIDKYRIKNNK